MKFNFTKEITARPCQPNDKELHILSPLQNILKNKILNPTPFFGFDEEKDNILKLIQNTVLSNESNSALLIGPVGSGKSLLVRNVLEELSREKRFHKNAVVVTLNGFIHTDDRLALIAISRQMNLQNVVEDRVTGTFAENLTLLLETLRSVDQGKAIIFVLEELGLFCDHPQQTLLYNLFDIAHSNKAAICVLGLTTKLDVLELMEKRVKSRFSHRHIYLLPRSDNDAQEKYIQHCKNFLRLEPGDLDLPTVSRWNKSVEKLLSPGQTPYVQLQQLFQFDTSQQAIKDFLLQVVCSMDSDSVELQEEYFNTVFESVTSDGRMLLAEGLSIPEICLLIAMKQLSVIYQGEPINFAMVYKRYNQFEKRHSTMQETPREVLRKAFEHLLALELVVPVRGIAGSTRAQREFQLHHFQLLPNQVRDLVRKTKELPVEVINWADMNVV